jgi:hypothetical protein
VFGLTLQNMDDVKVICFFWYVCTPIWLSAVTWVSYLSWGYVTCLQLFFRQALTHNWELMLYWYLLLSRGWRAHNKHGGDPCQFSTCVGPEDLQLIKAIVH